MKTYSTREAAELLGIHLVTLQRYIRESKVTPPPVVRIGAGKFRAWKQSDVERVRKQMSKIKDGRKK